MPKFIKCWFKDCDSDNRQQPPILFYRFPKDHERCEQWINSCSNEELTEIWRTSKDRVNALRICQKHFLKEFLGSTNRLVNHAVPAPYGVALDQIDAEKFMINCANLKSSTALICQNNQLLQYQIQPQQESSYLINGQNNQYATDRIVDTTHEQPVPSSSSYVPVDIQQEGLLMTIDQSDSYNLVELPVENHDNTSFVSNNDADLTTPCTTIQGQLPIVYTQNPEAEVEVESSFRFVDPAHNTTISDNGSGNHPCVEPNQIFQPRISYDREGSVVNIQYTNETVSSVKTQDSEQTQALKHKVRYYQRKCAVINHRYQKLKAQTKGRSNKSRLLEYLKICRADFEPCVYEIFESQVRGSCSKNGNRWSNDVKRFSSSIYLRSRSAYKFIRKTIDLPSESIVKRYITDKKLCKLSNLCDDPSDSSEINEKS